MLILFRLHKVNTNGPTEYIYTHHTTSITRTVPTIQVFAYSKIDTRVFFPPLILNERVEPLFQDVEYGGKKQSKCEKDEEFVCEFTPVVFQEEFPSQVDRGRHGFKPFARFQY